MVTTYFFMNEYGVLVGQQSCEVSSGIIKAQEKERYSLIAQGPIRKKGFMTFKSQ